MLLRYNIGFNNTLSDGLSITAISHIITQNDAAEVKIATSAAFCIINQPYKMPTSFVKL